MDSRTGLPVVGMVGGGQLARMTHQAAIALGQSLRVLSISGDDSAALVASDVLIGTHTCIEDLRRLAATCDVLTFDHEHVAPADIRALQDEGVSVQPRAEAVLFAQDKLAMRERISRWSGMAVPRWAPVCTAEDLLSFATEWPVVLKAATGGYDGKGVWMLSGPEEAGEIVGNALAGGIRLLAEELVPLRRELAVLLARSPFGQVAAWQVVQTVQERGVCVEVIAPAPGLDPGVATRIEAQAIALAEELGVTGVMAIELFERTDGQILLNELAMRPHNSGHWTIDGAVTSQFEQHLRAVLDYPLGDPAARAPFTVMANVLGGDDEGVGLDERVHHLMARWPQVKIHLYGKQVRPGRKIGHVTVFGSQLSALREMARAAAAYLQHGEFPTEERPA